MEFFIKRADTEDVEKEGELVDNKTVRTSRRSVLEELAKLGRLQKQGLLTNEEFLAKKMKLLS